MKKTGKGNLTFDMCCCFCFFIFFPWKQWSEDLQWVRFGKFYNLHSSRRFLFKRNRKNSLRNNMASYWCWKFIIIQLLNRLNDWLFRQAISRPGPPNWHGWEPKGLYCFSLRVQACMKYEIKQIYLKSRLREESNTTINQIVTQYLFVFLEYSPYFVEKEW